FLRGEHVATYRRHDARYLLAHLARLDKFAEENARACRDAERFEDMLAAMAGQALPDGFAEAARDAGAGEEDVVVPTRAEFVTWVRGDIHDAEVGCRGEEPLSEEELAAREAREWAVVDIAGEDAGREYDCWQAENHALIDRMTGWVCEGEPEVSEEVSEEAPDAEAETPGTVSGVSTPPSATTPS